MILPKSFFKTDFKLQKEQDKIFSNKVKDRDGWACVICASTFHPNAHHIIPREQKDFRYEIWNGLTLCIKHHKFSRVISAHNAPIAFFLWLAKYKSITFEIVTRKIKEILLKEQIVL